MNRKRLFRRATYVAMTFVLGLSAVPAQSLLEIQGSSSFASSVSCAGDVNADGIPDLAVADDVVGAVEIRSGLDGSLIRTISVPANGQSFGNLPSYALDHLGDVDGDGREDLLIGRVGDALAGLAGYVPTGPGSAYVISGLTGATLHTFAPISAEQSFGFAAAAIGDIDGDNVVDFAVGAPMASTQGKSENGYIRVYSGATGSVIRTHHGGNSSIRLGQSLAAGSDLDGDGVVDYLATSLVNSGSVRVFSGATGNVIANYSAGSSSLGASFGLGFPDVEVAGGADVDGDGIADIVFGKRGDTTMGTNAGAIFVISGATGQIVMSWFGNPCDGLGAKLELVDVNADGRADVVAAKRNDLGHQDDVTVFSGVTTAEVMNTDELIGDLTQVAPAGDIDGDGVEDLVGGTDPNGANPGHLIVIGGGPWLGQSAKGVITDASGDLEDVLRIDSAAGGRSRRIDLGIGDAFSFEVDQPSQSSLPAGFVVFGEYGAVSETRLISMPANIGDFSIYPVLMTPWAQPLVFTLASSLGPIQGGEILTATKAPWSAQISGGIRFPITFTLQAVVETSPGTLRASNALIVRVR